MKKLSLTKTILVLVLLVGGLTNVNAQSTIGKINGVQLIDYGSVVRLRVEDAMSDMNFSFIGDKEELYNKIVELQKQPITAEPKFFGEANMVGEDAGQGLKVYMSQYGKQFYLYVAVAGQELLRSVYITPKKLDKIFGI